MGILITSCSSQKIQSPDEVECNSDNVGEEIYDGCNWCTCSEFDEEFGWVCTERACNIDPKII